MHYQTAVAVALLATVVSQTAAAAQTQAQQQFPDAQAAARRASPEATLLLYGGMLSRAEGCADHMDTYFDFTGPNQVVVVTYEHKRQDDACVPHERVAVHEGYPAMGRYALEYNGNLDKVQVEWNAAVKAMQVTYPQAQWTGRFEVSTPMHPDYLQQVYYYFDVGSGQILVDATTGQVAQP